MRKRTIGASKVMINPCIGYCFDALPEALLAAELTGFGLRHYKQV